MILGLARAVTLGSKSRRNHDHILLSRLRILQPGGPGPVFISPRNRVAQLYPRALGSLSVASYDSQGYGADILSRFCGMRLYTLTGQLVQTALHRRICEHLINFAVNLSFIRHKMRTVVFPSSASLYSLRMSLMCRICNTVRKLC
jgi:hypothetical protein